MARELVNTVGKRLAEAWLAKEPIARLAPAERPASDDEALAVQERMISVIGREVGGWKAGAKKPIRGAIFAEDILPSPAEIHASSLHLCAIEGEVAFRFHRALPPREWDYTRDEVAASLWACAAIEIVDSRYKDFPATGELERLADLLSSGALVFGVPVEHWRHLELDRISVELFIDEQSVLRREGGHPTGDPLQGCVMLVNALRQTTGVASGRIVTAGTYTGITTLPAGSTATVRFEGLGEATVTFIH